MTDIHDERCDAVSIRNVTKRYGHHTAVDSLSLSLSDGEIFAFLGPNGAGKTTTIKMLVGLLFPDAGEIQIGGFDVTQDRHSASRLVGYVPDQPYVYDKLTGCEFLTFVGNIYGLAPDELARNMDLQIEQFELSPFIDQLSETYSHGMKQRLVLAAAMVHEPRLIILDEPMVGLDPRSMRTIKDLLRRETKDNGRSVFMSTHTLPLVEEIADRVGVICGGQLSFCGTVGALLEHRERGDTNLEEVFLDMTETTSPDSPLNGGR